MFRSDKKKEEIMSDASSHANNSTDKTVARIAFYTPKKQATDAKRIQGRAHLPFDKPFFQPTMDKTHDIPYA